MKIEMHTRRALVTGSTSGMGFAIAKGLAEAGAEVILHGSTSEHVGAAKARLDAELSNARVGGIAADLSDLGAVDRLIQDAGDIDILISNGGPTEAKPFFELTDEDWDRFIRIYLLTPVRLARHFARRMVDKRWGRVLFNAHVVSGLQPAEMVHWGYRQGGPVGSIARTRRKCFAKRSHRECLRPWPNAYGRELRRPSSRLRKHVQRDREGTFRRTALNVNLAPVHPSGRGGQSCGISSVGPRVSDHRRRLARGRRHYPIASVIASLRPAKQELSAPRGGPVRRRWTDRG
jgi:NAD(P)-dependent dehydrogenase (short-subunit alcohol dehydrogenase family)